MSTDTQEAARTALSRRLRELLPAETTEHFIGGTHTRRFADNLLPSFSAEQVRALRAQLARGAGDELAATASGKRRAHAAYSSAALAANAFGGWMGAENRDSSSFGGEWMGVAASGGAVSAVPAVPALVAR